MLAAAVDIRRWLREDRHTPHVERLNRDRQIGRSLPAASDSVRLLGWWSVISHASPADASPGGDGTVGTGERLVGLRRGATAVLFVVGVVFGVGGSGLAFGYQGDHPVNLFTLLGVLVGIPKSIVQPA